MKIKHKCQFSIDYGKTGLTAGNWSVIILYQISIISIRVFFFFSSVSKDNLKMFKTETNIQFMHNTTVHTIYNKNLCVEMKKNQFND